MKIMISRISEEGELKLLENNVQLADLGTIQVGQFTTGGALLEFATMCFHNLGDAKFIFKPGDEIRIKLLEK